MEFPRVLIISPEPYRDNSSSRCLSSFFGQWDKDCIAQFYTTNDEPEISFCNKYFRITDKDILNSFFHRKVTGKAISMIGESRNDENICKLYNKSLTLLEWIKRRISLKTPLFHLIRLALWRERYWNTKGFMQWIDAFSPEILFLDLGSDNRLANIALSLSRRKKIPIITFLPDDFYFKIKKSILPSTCIYNYLFKKTTDLILSKSIYCIFSCDMMKEVYTEKFGCAGEVLYFTSNIERVPFEKRVKNTYSYLGSLEYGRWKSIVKLSHAIQSISKDYYIDVFGSIENKDCLEIFKSSDGIRFHGKVSYSKVKEVMSTSEYVIHVEDFDSRNKRNTKYSLSTKIADCLKCGAITIAFGPLDVGSIDYLRKTESAFVCTSEINLSDEIRKLIDNPELKEIITNNSYLMAKRNHTAESNQNRMREICESVICNRNPGGI